MPLISLGGHAILFHKHSLFHWNRPPSREVWAVSFNWQWTENELWTPHALWVRTQAIHYANMAAAIKKDTQAVGCKFVLHNQMLWLLIQQYNVCFFKKVGVKCRGTFDIHSKMQIKKQILCCIIGYFSHLTPTTVWYNVRASTTNALTVTDGVVCSWACYRYSLKETFF